MEVICQEAPCRLNFLKLTTTLQLNESKKSRLSGQVTNQRADRIYKIYMF